MRSPRRASFDLARSLTDSVRAQPVPGKDIRCCSERASFSKYHTRLMSFSIGKFSLRRPTRAFAYCGLGV